MTLDKIIERYNELINKDNLTLAERGELISIERELVFLQGELAMLREVSSSPSNFSQDAISDIDKTLNSSSSRA